MALFMATLIYMQPPQKMASAEFTLRPTTVSEYYFLEGGNVNLAPFLQLKELGATRYAGGEVEGWLIPTPSLSTVQAFLEQFAIHPFTLSTPVATPKRARTLLVTAAELVLLHSLLQLKVEYDADELLYRYLQLRSDLRRGDVVEVASIQTQKSGVARVTPDLYVANDRKLVPAEQTASGFVLPTEFTSPQPYPIMYFTETKLGSRVHPNFYTAGLQLAYVVTDEGNFEVQATESDGFFWELFFEAPLTQDEVVAAIYNKNTIYEAVSETRIRVSLTHAVSEAPSDLFAGVETAAEEEADDAEDEEDYLEDERLNNDDSAEAYTYGPITTEEALAAEPVIPVPGDPAPLKGSVGTLPRFTYGVAVLPDGRIGSAGDLMIR
ncbi:Hypothetical protein POVN_LOCUS105 [uncultured virus]|nr:Hypothetical protein POVN_LOCUS105 [uncultured virus]